MTTRKRLHRLLAGLIGAAGLAYPACAAVCPRGIGGCPSPGRCFLFTDLDANSVCDYTRTAVGASPTGTTTTASATATATPVSTTPAAVPATTTAAPVPVSSGAGAAGLTSVSALLAGLLVALAAAVAAFVLLRSGRLGPAARETGAALALSSFFALGAGGIATYLLSGEAASASLFAAAWLLAGSVLGAYAWRRGAVTRPLALALAGTSALVGFAVLAPLMPVEFVGLVTLVAGGGSLLAPAAVGVLGGIALAFAVGRTFCGHACPVGAVQELAYAAPVPKYVVRHPRHLEAARAVVFVASVAAALSLVNLMAYTGVYEFFSLTVSAGLAVFAGLLALSTVVYRPVCRTLCPFGLLFSLSAHVGRYRLRRTAACVDCRRCEAACPAGAAGRDASKRECYLCGRCVEACRVAGALAYTAANVSAAPSSRPRLTPARSSHRPAPPVRPPRAIPRRPGGPGP
ncbi:MAG: 4Fe-4S binding protein [Methanospirillum sp.]